MKKDEELDFKLREVLGNFQKEEYEKSLLILEEAGKLVISALNVYNKRKK